MFDLGLRCRRSYCLREEKCRVKGRLRGFRIFPFRFPPLITAFYCHKEFNGKNVFAQFIKLKGNSDLFDEFSFHGGRRQDIPWITFHENTFCKPLRKLRRFMKRIVTEGKSIIKLFYRRNPDDISVAKWKMEVENEWQEWNRENLNFYRIVAVFMIDVALIYSTIRWDSFIKFPAFRPEASRKATNKYSNTHTRWKQKKIIFDCSASIKTHHKF